MAKTHLSTDKAPAPVGAYSQGVMSGNLIFASGQIPLDPVTGVLVEGGARAQAERALDNLEAVLQAGRSSLSQALKITVYLADLDWFDEVNEVFLERFGSSPPAREVVEVSRLPKGAGIEVSAIALAPGA